MRYKLALLTMLASISMATPALAGDQDFRLVNQTGYTVREVYVSSTATNDWEEDILDVDTLADEASVDVLFDRSGRTGCLYDLKLVYNDGDTEEWDRIDLCEISTITVRYDRNGTAVADFD